MNKIIKIQWLLFMLLVLSSCKIGNLGNLEIIPKNDTHMHGITSTPHSHMHTHRGDHLHKYLCEYKGKEYRSNKSCGTKYIHMHGLKSKPHTHHTVIKNHGRGYQCQYLAKGKIYTSDKDCGLHTHKHLHSGLTTTVDDPHGYKTKGGHEHNHKHTGEHAHDEQSKGYYCKTDLGGFVSPVPCLPIHQHVHMHDSSHIPHSHKHDHKNEHDHVSKSERCVGPGNDHKYYYAPSYKCTSKHKHKIMDGNDSKPIIKKHIHKKDTVALKQKPHPFICLFDGKTYQSEDTCKKPHTHEHSHYDKSKGKWLKHVHEHIFSFKRKHHRDGDEPK